MALLHRQACKFSLGQVAQVWLARTAAKLQDRWMAEDVENHTVRLLQEMRGEMRDSLAATRDEMREGFAGLRQRLDGVDQRLDRVEQRLDGVERRLGVVEGTLGKVIDAVTEIAKVQEKHSGLLVELVESDRIAGARLNAVEARLGRIENKTVLGLQ